MYLFRHAGVEEPAPYLIRGHPGEVLDVLARIRSLRLPSVARLEFIPMKIGAGMTTFMKTVVYGQTLITGSSRFRPNSKLMKY
jgi:hypothetical protein